MWANPPVDMPECDATHVVALPAGPGIDHAFQPARASQHDRLRVLFDRQRHFAAHAAHELRTPLAALRLQLEEAQSYRDDADLHAAIDDALSSTERLEKAVINLLSLVRPDASP